MSIEEGYIYTKKETFSPEVFSRLTSFLDSGPRNKFVFVKNVDLLADIPSVNIGYELASYIQSIDNTDFKSDCMPYIKKLISDNTILHPILGKYIYLKNIGILFEPELGLDVNLFLTNQSRNTLLLLDWNGQMKYPYMYFLQTDSKHRIKIDTLNYTTL